MTLTRLRTWIGRHSLSLTLGLCSAVFTYASAAVEHGSWWYDYLMSWAAGMGTNAILFPMLRWLYEIGADATKKPPR